MAFEMPKIRVGDIVLHHQGGTRAPGARPAMVVQVNNINEKTSPNGTSLALAVFDPASYNLAIRDGVRHVDDPMVRIQSDETRSQGVWDLTPQSLEIAELRKIVAAMQNKKS